MKNKNLVFLLGGLFFALYVVLLWFRPTESWCDDAYWTDWGRQLGLYNKYYTTVWGGGKPSYSPLYALLLGGWIKIFGFSFFKVQMLNMVLTLLCYLLLGIGLVKQKVIEKKSSLVLFSMLFWLSPTTFWVYNSGRMEVLCLLLGLGVCFSFVAFTKNKNWKSALGVCLCSTLLFMTAVEGVVFATIFCVIYSCLSIKKGDFSFKTNILAPYSLHFGGYVLGMVSCCVITHINNCLHAFLDTMFGFSATFSGTYRYLRALVKYIRHGIPIEIETIEAVAPKSPFFDRLLAGLSSNLDYCVVALVLLVLVIVVLATKKKEIWTKTTKVLTVMAFVTPIIFVFAGRYAIYYTWAAYIPTIIALAIVVEKLPYSWIYSVIGGMVVSLFFAFDGNTFQRFDYNKEIDKKNLAEIQAAMPYLSQENAVVIPYHWYYYVVEWNENIYFQWSTNFPQSLKYLIHNINEIPCELTMEDQFTLKKVDCIEDNIVYEVVGRLW